jgi:peptidoglycan/xylan/chitin deacetylase (PgdA/CDA1 family)
MPERVSLDPGRRVRPAATWIDGQTTRARRVVGRRLAGTAHAGVVLCYHRVADVPSDPWSLAVPPERFAEHVRLLADGFEPLPLDRLVTLVAERRAPRGAVAVTFDDGYADNLLAAAPILERHGVPATVFAATEAIASSTPWWWHELEATLLGAAPWPDELHVRVGRRTRSWPTRDAGQRRAAHDDLQWLLRRAGPAAREQIMEQLRAWRPRAAEETARLARPLTVEQLRRLPDHGVEVGAHGHAHLALHAQPARAMEHDIALSRRLLEEWLGRPPRGFAYPFGDHAPAVRRAVRRLGFRWATGVLTGAVTRFTDRYDLPRLVVAGEDAATVERRLVALQRRASARERR